MPQHTLGLLRPSTTTFNIGASLNIALDAHHINRAIKMLRVAPAWDHEKYITQNSDTLAVDEDAATYKYRHAGARLLTIGTRKKHVIIVDSTTGNTQHAQQTHQKRNDPPPTNKTAVSRYTSSVPCQHKQQQPLKTEEKKSSPSLHGEEAPTTRFTASEARVGPHQSLILHRRRAIQRQSAKTMQNYNILIDKPLTAQQHKIPPP